MVDLLLCSPDRRMPTTPNTFVRQCASKLDIKPLCVRSSQLHHLVADFEKLSIEEGAVRVKACPTHPTAPAFSIPLSIQV